MSSDYNSNNIQRHMVFMTTVAYDESLQVVPYLAERWDTVRVAGDSLELTFHIRQDVRWHDGTPTTAHDVAWTLGAARDPGTGYPRLVDLEPISEVGFQFGDYFDTVIPVPKMWGFDHAYGVDRYGFDELLWRHVARYPSVQQREGFSVRDVLRDADGRVVGVVGSERAGSDEEIRSRCVIGADGLDLVADTVVR